MITAACGFLPFALATILERTLERAFRAAGGNPSRQPSTYNLLGGYFTKEDITNLFCGAQSKKDSELRKDLAMKFLDVSLDNKSTLLELEAVRAKFPKPPVATDHDANAAIRFDLKLPAGGPPDCPFELG